MKKISKSKNVKVLQTPKVSDKKAPAKAAVASRKVAAPAPALGVAPVVDAIRATSAKATTPEERHRMVAEAAYYIALTKGFNSDPAENWFEAEKEVDSRLKAAGKR